MIFVYIVIDFLFSTFYPYAACCRLCIPNIKFKISALFLFFFFFNILLSLTYKQLHLMEFAVLHVKRFYLFLLFLMNICSSFFCSVGVLFQGTVEYRMDCCNEKRFSGLLPSLYFLVRKFACSCGGPLPPLRANMEPLN